MDLEELWDIQEGQGRDLTIVVPAGDPEFGPYTGYSFAAAGEALEPGYRMLTQEEVSAVLAGREFEEEA